MQEINAGLTVSRTFQGSDMLRNICKSNGVFNASRKQSRRKGFGLRHVSSFLRFFVSWLLCFFVSSFLRVSFLRVFVFPVFPHTKVIFLLMLIIIFFDAYNNFFDAHALLLVVGPYITVYSPKIASKDVQ